MSSSCRNARLPPPRRRTFLFMKFGELLVNLLCNRSIVREVFEPGRKEGRLGVPALLPLAQKRKRQKRIRQEMAEKDKAGNWLRRNYVCILGNVYVILLYL